MKEILFKGAGVAIVTPFNENGICFAELARLIDFQIENGTDAIIITGTTGESATMTDAEHKEAIRFTVEQVKKRVPVIAGTGSNDTAYALQLSQYAKEVGVDGLLLVTPYYNKCSQKGLIQHFTYIADRVDLPVILYNVPSRTGVNIAIDTYAILAKHPRIVAVKEASGDLSAVLEIRRRCRDQLHVYSGNDDQIVPILSLGGLGVISVLSNIMPKETHEICEAFFSGDIKKSQEMQINLADLIHALFIEVNPIPVKTALSLMGYQVGPLRMPLCEMDKKNLEHLKQMLKAHNLL